MAATEQSIPSQKAGLRYLNKEGATVEPTHRMKPLAEPSERGETFIEDEVVSVIARRAAERVPGIHRIGEPTLRRFLPTWTERNHGIDAEVGLKEAAVDIEIVIEFGYPIREVAASLRRSIIDAVETMTGRTMVEVNIFVVDIYAPEREARRRRELA